MDNASMDSTSRALEDLATEFEPGLQSLRESLQRVHEIPYFLRVRNNGNHGQNEEFAGTAIDPRNEIVECDPDDKTPDIKQITDQALLVLSKLSENIQTYDLRMKTACVLEIPNMDPKKETLLALEFTTHHTSSEKDDPLKNSLIMMLPTEAALQVINALQSSSAQRVIELIRNRISFNLNETSSVADIRNLRIGRMDPIFDFTMITGRPDNVEIIEQQRIDKDLQDWPVLENPE